MLDIVPTYEVWRAMDDKVAMQVWHWLFLAQARPLPETLIGKSPLEYWNWLTASWTKRKDLACFDRRALAHYHAFFQDPLRIHATCEDYRAGRGPDLAHDESDRTAGRKIACPLLVLWGDAGIPSETANPVTTWRAWASDVQGQAIDAGHFLCEEAPEPTAAAPLELFST